MILSTARSFIDYRQYNSNEKEDQHTTLNRTKFQATETQPPAPTLKKNNNKKETHPKLLQREQIDLNKLDRLNSNLAKRNQPSRDYFFIVVVEQPILIQRLLQLHQLLLQLYILPMN